MTQKVMEFSLDLAKLEKFNEDGFIGPFDLCSEAEMEEDLRKLHPKLINTKTSIYSATDSTVSGAPIWRTTTATWTSTSSRNTLRSRRSPTGWRVSSVPTSCAGGPKFFPKYPGDEGTDWHQADNFSNVARSEQPQIVWPEDAEFGGTITVRSAFTEASVDTGAHRQLQKDPNWSPDESKAVSQVMRPGQFVIFRTTLMHASHPHSGLSKKMRLGFAARDNLFGADRGAAERA